MRRTQQKVKPTSDGLSSVEGWRNTGGDESIIHDALLGLVFLSVPQDAALTLIFCGEMFL